MFGAPFNSSTSASTSSSLPATPPVRQNACRVGETNSECLKDFRDWANKCVSVSVCTLFNHFISMLMMMVMIIVCVCVFMFGMR